jgi:hypothetical protein
MNDSMMPLPALQAEPSSVPPSLMLTHNRKAFKLPPFVCEYEKVAFEAAQDRADYPRYLLRLCKLERIDRERPLKESTNPSCMGLRVAII